MANSRTTIDITVATRERLVALKAEMRRAEGRLISYDEAIRALIDRYKGQGGNPRLKGDDE